MIESSTFHFLYPEWLFLLPVVWILIYKITRINKIHSSWVELCDPELLALLLPDTHNSKGKLYTILLTLILSLGVFALTGPSWKQEKYPALETASARVLIFDLSQSMLVEDVKPNRLTLARTAAKTILTSNYEGETGLVVFSGSAFQVAPLTRDKNTLLEFLTALSPDSMPEDGNSLNLALARAGKLLSNAVSGKGSIIVFSDGFDDSDQLVSIAEKFGDQGHRIFTIPIGTDQGGPLVKQDGSMIRDANGKVVIARTNRRSFHQIAEAGNGQSLEVHQVPGNLHIFEERSDDRNTYMNNNENDEFLTIADNGGIVIVWLIVPLLLLLFRKNALLLILVALLIPYSPRSFAFDLTSFFLNHEQQAIQAYEQSDYAKVIQLTNNKNLVASAHFKSGDYETSLAVFSAQNTALAKYNKGNALVHLERYSEALESYEQALMLDESIKAAKFNINLIRQFLQSRDPDDTTNSNTDSNTDRTEDSSTDTDLSRAGQSEGNEESQVDSIEAGIGASFLSENSRLNEDENEAAELALELFVRQLQQQNFDPDPQMIQAWTETRKADPFDFFKRKFLRDYRRNQSDGR